jgi:hypothetical protein
VRAGPGVDDGVQALELEVPAVVPATAQVGAVEVVRGVGDPLRHEPPILLVQVDVDELPVGLVVVDAVEARAPVVVGEEEPVLADRPAALANDPPVVDVALVALLHGDVLERRGGGRRLRHAPAQQQRGGEDRVEQPQQQAAARQAPESGSEGVALVALQALETRERAGVLLEAERVHEAQVEERPEAGRAPLDQPLDAQLALGDDPLVAVVRVVEPERAGVDVALDVHREELLAAREAHDRLERPQQLELSRCRADSGWVG